MRGRRTALAAAVLTIVGGGLKASDAEHLDRMITHVPARSRIIRHELRS